MVLNPQLEFMGPLHLVTQTPPAILVRQGQNDIVNRLCKVPFC